MVGVVAVGLMVAVVLAVVVCLVVRVRRRDGGKITDTSRGHNPTYTGEHSWCSNLYLLSDVSMMPNVLYDYDSESI